jgi:perosamine synthetase
MSLTTSLRVSAPLLGNEENEAVARIMASGQLANGPEVMLFERELADRLTSSADVVAVSSGTAALELSLEALDVGPGTEVITTPFTFGATVAAALRRGAHVRFADIREDLTIDPNAVARLVNERTAAVIAVHLYGLPADIHALNRLGPPIVEDAAQAAGAMIDDKRVGSLGVMGTLSFYPK